MTGGDGGDGVVFNQQGTAENEETGVTLTNFGKKGTESK
jgi:hypothetical protein